MMVCVVRVKLLTWPLRPPPFWSLVAAVTDVSYQGHPRHPCYGQKHTISLKCDARHGGEAETDEDELGEMLAYYKKRTSLGRVYTKMPAHKSFHFGFWILKLWSKVTFSSP